MGTTVTMEGLGFCLKEAYPLGPVSIQVAQNGFIVTAEHKTFVFESQSSMFSFLKSHFKEKK